MCGKKETYSEVFRVMNMSVAKNFVRFGLVKISTLKIGRQDFVCAENWSRTNI